VTDEYWLAHTKLGFSREEIERMILYGFESAFLTHQERTTMVEQAKLELQKLRD
jgi:adenosine deaminase